MLKDIREVTDAQEYAAELKHRWTSLLSYRYIGRNMTTPSHGATTGSGALTALPEEGLALHSAKGRLALVATVGASGMRRRASTCASNRSPRRSNGAGATAKSLARPPRPMPKLNRPSDSRSRVAAC